MYNSNPFGSWSQAGNGHSRSTLWGPAAAHSPSIYGALPYIAPPSAATLTTFYFTSLNPGVLNCTVMGADSRPLFYVVTDSSMPGYTVLRGLNGKNVALIEWQAHPLVEVRGLICKQAVHTWLGLSSTRSARYMQVRGMKYAWVPQEHFINLYTSASPPQFLGRISRDRASIRLEMTTEATQLGLLDVSVVAAILLQCGRNID